LDLITGKPRYGKLLQLSLFVLLAFYFHEGFSLYSFHKNISAQTAQVDLQVVSSGNIKLPKG